ncbi:MAG: serine hydrolase, partial [Candidatus Poribacteria bacterium]|nr:serine hydrolase [Candidatus Poribacteria bacterium]
MNPTLPLFSLLILALWMIPAVVAHAAGAWVTPGEAWERASPVTQGLSAEKIDAAAAYAEQYGGGAGCIVRHGYIVKEWGDPSWRADIKSSTKGSFGTTALGVAVDRGLVKLDDLAQHYYPQIGTEEASTAEKGWLEKITVRQLATMTAGFSDGRPPTFEYEPGTSGIYSNDTSNMLAELLTITFGEDLTTVMKREVMDKIGASADGWRWRDNGYRAKTVNGLSSREFASGITINYETMARIGLLYLRGGEWNGRQILSRE